MADKGPSKTPARSAPEPVRSAHLRGNDPEPAKVVPAIAAGPKVDRSAGKDVDAARSAAGQLAGRLDELKRALDGLASRPDPVDLIKAHEGQLAQILATLGKFPEPERPEPILAQVKQMAAQITVEARRLLVAERATAAREVESIREGLEAVRSELGRLSGEIEEGRARPPVELDARAVGELILDHLADSARAREVFARQLAADSQERNDELGQVLRKLPDLFDAVEIPLETWEVGSKLDDDQRSARDQVLKVLRQIKRKFDDWKLLQQIDEVPGDPEEGQPFDPFWHVRDAVESTDDPARRGTIARVVTLGYRRDRERIRKAAVVVYVAPAPDGVAALPTPASTVQPGGPPRS